MSLISAFCRGSSVEARACARTRAISSPLRSTWSHPSGISSRNRCAVLIGHPSPCPSGRSIALAVVETRRRAPVRLVEGVGDLGDGVDDAPHLLLQLVLAVVPPVLEVLCSAAGQLASEGGIEVERGVSDVDVVLHEAHSLRAVLE